MNVELNHSTYDLQILYAERSILTTRSVKIGGVEHYGTITFEQRDNQWQIHAATNPITGYQLMPIGDKQAKLKHHCNFMQSIVNAFNLYMREHPELLEAVAE